MTTGIEWTEETWNPVTGCTHVSEGCDHCYAAREASGRLKTHPAYEGLAVDGKFTGEVRLLPERLEQPLRWKRPRTIFVNSMSDLFHDAVPDEFIARIFAVMAVTPRHTYQILTKRPGRMASLLSRPDFCDRIRTAELPTAGLQTAWNDELYPLPNVWLGTSVETQKWANVRIPLLAQTPAAVRFLSCEPLLGPVDLHGWLVRDVDVLAALDMAIQWVIVGGESGPDARPMHPDWARGIRDQSAAAGVPFFLKQWGEWAPLEGTGAAEPTPVGYWTRETDAVGQEHRVIYTAPDDGHQLGAPVLLSGITSSGAEHMARVGRAVAGRFLDGRRWEQMPEVPAWAD